MHITWDLKYLLTEFLYYFCFNTNFNQSEHNNDSIFELSGLFAIWLLCCHRKSPQRQRQDLLQNLRHTSLTGIVHTWKKVIKYTLQLYSVTLIHVNILTKFFLFSQLTLTHLDDTFISKCLVVRHFWSTSRSQSLYLVKCVLHSHSTCTSASRGFAPSQCLVPVNLTWRRASY